jgi:hypothetical protein
MKRISLFGSMVILVAGVTSLGQEGKKEKSPNYYPLEVGNTWHYRVLLKGKESTVTWTVSKYEKINGETVARLESAGVNANSNVMQSDKGVFQQRTLGADVTPPFKLLAYPIKIGAKWSGSFTEGKDETKYTYEAEIVKTESVEVPAGKFKAIVVQMKLDANGKRMTDSRYWFVEDVGYVKHTYAIGDLAFVLELERFERKK